MKTAIITGTSYGLGFSLIQKLLDTGYKVYGISRTETKIKNSNFVWLKCDLYSEKEIKDAVCKITEEKIDLIINNAGVVFAEDGLDINIDTFEKTFKINLLAPILITGELKNKINGALIVNISSTSDRFAEEKIGIYCASKSALGIYFQSVALEYPEIKFLTILPVYIDTPMLKDISSKLNFSVDKPTKPEILAESVSEIILSKNRFESGAKIMLLQENEIESETGEHENLYYYNLDKKEIKKVK
jgi:NAD(P)-dependent dehydrogenase (short-subunit alcohol dehydrogenase family)